MYSHMSPSISSSLSFCNTLRAQPTNEKPNDFIEYGLEERNRDSQERVCRLNIENESPNLLDQTLVPESPEIPNPESPIIVDETIWDPNNITNQDFRNVEEEQIFIILGINVFPNEYNHHLIYRNVEGIDSDCPICLESITSDTAVQMFPCNHLVHRECLMDYVQAGIGGTTNRCSTCRSEYSLLLNETYRINWIYSDGSSLMNEDEPRYNTSQNMNANLSRDDELEENLLQIRGEHFSENDNQRGINQPENDHLGDDSQRAVNNSQRTDISNESNQIYENNQCVSEESTPRRSSRIRRLVERFSQN